MAWLPHGDLVSACADYTARVWTSNAEQVASAEAVAGLSAAVAARKQPQQAQGQDAPMGALPPGLKIEEASVLLQPGKKDGNTKIVKEGGAGVAYSWDASRCALYICTHRNLFSNSRVRQMLVVFAMQNICCVDLSAQNRCCYVFVPVASDVSTVMTSAHMANASSTACCRQELILWLILAVTTCTVQLMRACTYTGVNGRRLEL